MKVFNVAYQEIIRTAFLFNSKLNVAQNEINVQIELKIKLFCFFTIRAMGWIFIAVRKQIFKSFGCTKIRKDTKYTKTSLSKVMQPKTSNNDSRPILPYHVHDQAGFDNLFIDGRIISKMSYTF